MRLLLALLTVFLTIIAVWLIVALGRRENRSKVPFWDRYKPKSRGNTIKTSNLILLALGIFALAFITAMIVIFCVKGAVPDTLIQYTLGAGGVEALLLAGIKVSKVLTGDKPGEREGTYDEQN